MSKKGKVLVAMSGGIDSTVTAMMLHEQGYEIIGMTMKTWDYASAGGNTKETGCCSLDSINDARAVSVDMGFPHFIIDIREEFGDYVIDNFVDEYLAGRTPNPCILCNTHIKWEALLKRADALGCEFIATGHYAQIKQDDTGRYSIHTGVDDYKDQSYVLWGLSQEVLARTMFPIGNFTKKEIREYAVNSGYESLANKPESYEICFIPDNDYRGFLKRRVAGLEKKVDGGNFISTSGEVLGQHKGYPFYTIGQRKGLEIAFGEPRYVTEIRPGTNEVVLGLEEELELNAMLVSKLNMVKYPSVADGTEAISKIRYNDKGAFSTLHPEGDNMKVVFQGMVKAIAPGQSAVFYEGDEIIGGGIIMKQLPIVPS